MATLRFTTPQIHSFRQLLLAWYAHAQRKLPWRGQTDPYRILVSEVMLQQTRVAVVIERYTRFLERFPTVERLARARQQSVLAEWSGLGYYRRARSLHAAAKAATKSGGFPRSSRELMEFPGVGRYTAAAVASIAYGEPVPVVDGNVKRVLDRIAGCELNEQGYWNSAGDLLDHNHPGEFNQAMMEFGATLCLPRNPLCRECPVIELCASRGAREQQKQERRRKATLKYALVQREGKILLQRRPADSSLMPGMWELPEIRNTRREPLVTLRHSITDTDYTVLVYDDERGAAAEACWIPLRNVTRLPLTGLTAKILRAHRLLPA